MSEYCIESKVDIRDHKLVSTIKEFPTTYQLDYIPQVKNQAWLSACVAFAASSIVEYFHYKETGRSERFSEGYIYGTRYSFTGEGMSIRDALKTLQTKGDVMFGDFPIVKEVPDIIDEVKNAGIDDLALPYRISEYYKVTTTEEIKEALLHGPVIFSINWRKGAKVEDDTLILDETAENEGGHCMLIYGWNEKGWLFQNSWSGFWAGDGRATLPYSTTLKEAWGVTDNITEVNTTKPKYKGLMKFFVSAINWIENTFIYIKNHIKKS